MMELFYLVNLITFIMLIWLNSDAIVAWGSLFGLSKFLKVEEFRHARLENVIRNVSLSYPQFLKEKYNYNFITQMLSCPLCLCIWLSSIACVIIGIVLLNPLAIFLIPTVSVLSLLTYGVITTLIKLV